MATRLYLPEVMAMFYGWATGADFNILKTCSKLFYIAAKHCLLKTCTPQHLPPPCNSSIAASVDACPSAQHALAITAPSIITIVDSDACYYALLVSILVELAWC